MKTTEIQANKLKKFDSIELLNGLKMVDFVQFNSAKEINNSFMLIHYMDKTTTHCTTNECIKIHRPKKTYIHRRFEPIEY